MQIDVYLDYFVHLPLQMGIFEFQYGNFFLKKIWYGQIMEMNNMPVPFLTSRIPYMCKLETT